MIHPRLLVVDSPFSEKIIVTVHTQANAAFTQLRTDISGWANRILSRNMKLDLKFGELHHPRDDEKVISDLHQIHGEFDFLKVWFGKKPENAATSTQAINFLAELNKLTSLSGRKYLSTFGEVYFIVPHKVAFTLMKKERRVHVRNFVISPTGDPLVVVNEIPKPEVQFIYHN